ncbi:MAG TPA: 6-bladed beta-propeller [Gammaproteobacteria bacterium]|nr:6-bladed beta-propeller [Gammaproteobacteria bacterium]
MWPAPPEVPRFRYVGELTGEDNFVSTRTGLRRAGAGLVNWLVGLSSAKHVPTVLQRPQSGVAGDKGRIYVTDVSRQAVYVFDEGAGRLEVWDSAAENTRFVAPIGVALDGAGGILVADAELGFVARLDARGKPVSKLGEGELLRPTGLARDAGQGRIYVADTRAHQIKIFSDDGRLLKAFGRHGEGAGEFNAPTFISYANDRLYVTDTLNSRVQVFTAEGEFIRTFGRRSLFVGDMPRPKGVAVDKDGRIYVVESYYDYLLVFNADGELLLPIGGTGSGIGQFYLPAGVWTDQHDRVFIADSFNGRIVVLQFLRGGA